jgi:hypothetical protein
MPDIQVTFTNNTSDSHACSILDIGIDPNAPKQLFSDYLDAGASTAALALHSDDGIYGHAAYQLSGGAIQNVPDITDGTNVEME